MASIPSHFRERFALHSQTGDTAHCSRSFNTTVNV